MAPSSDDDDDSCGPGAVGIEMAEHRRGGTTRKMGKKKHINAIPEACTSQERAARGQQKFDYTSRFS